MGLLNSAEGDAAHDALFYRRLFEDAPDAIILANAQMRFVDANLAATLLLGYSRDELLARCVPDIVGNESDWIEDEFKRLERDGTWCGEVELRRKNSPPVVAEVSATPVPLPGDGTIVRATLRPLTDQRRAQSSLRLQSSLLDAVGEAVIATDLEGRVTFWNRAAETLYQWQCDEVLGHPIQQLLAPELAADQARKIVAQLHGGHAWSGEFAVQRKDKSTFLAHVTATPIRDANRRLIGMIGVCYDLTQQRRVQSTLRDQGMQLEDTERVAHVGTWELDLATQKLTWSDQHYRLFGLQPSRDPLDYVDGISRIHPDDLPRARKVLDRAIAKKSSYALELRVVWPDGTIHCIDSHGHFVADAAAGAGRMIGTALDITERKEAEQGQRTSETRFRQAAAVLEASEERLRTVLENAPLILFAVDGHGHSTMRTGRVLTSLAASHGFPATEHAGQSPYEVYNDHPQMQANLRRALAGESFSSLIEIDGHVFECACGPIRDASGELDGAVSVATDVTEREQARRNLQQLQDEHELILQSAGEGIYGQDCQGLTTFVNPAAARMLGWPVSGLIGRDMHATVHGTRADGSAYPREVCPIHAPVIDGGVHHATGELFWRQNGTSFPVEYISAPMHDGSSIIGAVVTFKDISERRAAEEERARLYKKLLERDKELHDAVGAILLSRSTAHVTQGERDLLARLTTRERDVLERLARGQTNAEIAQALGVGAGTVKSHVEHLLKKLGLVSRTQAAVWADRLGPLAFSSGEANAQSV